MTQWGLGNLRCMLDSEGQHDAIGDEEIIQQLIYNIEALIMLVLDTGDSGSATSDPPNDATGVLTDTGAAYDVDEHNGHSLVMTDGIAKNKHFAITDTTATTLVCNGVNLYAAGVRSGDSYKVVYDLINNTDGHDHDGVNSTPLTGRIGQAELKTATGSVSILVTGVGDFYTSQFTHQYAFCPYGPYKTSGTNTINWRGPGAYSIGTSAVAQQGVFECTAHTSNSTAYMQYRYVQASGEVHWVFLLRDKATQQILQGWEQPDHPCFGAGDPADIPHPFLSDYDPEKHEIIVINPSPAHILAMRKTAGTRCLLDVIQHDYEIDEKSAAPWPDVPITIGLPDEWEACWAKRKKISPVKAIIEQPEYILCRALTKKAVQPL